MFGVCFFCILSILNFLLEAEISGDICLGCMVNFFCVKDSWC